MLKKKGINPFLKPPLLIITPDVSDGKSSCVLDYLRMHTLTENGHALKAVVGDELSNCHALKTVVGIRHIILVS
jgi:hypothetical protein